MAESERTVAIRPAQNQVAADSTALIVAIERAARDPTVDVDKMERLLAMQERVMQREARAQYAAALSEMQPELPVIAERGRVVVSKAGHTAPYALWQDINRAIQPVLARYGFALGFKTAVDGDKVIVTGILWHCGSHSEETTLAMPADISGSKNPVQAIGSSISYGKRYCANALLNLTSSDEVDTDGDTGELISAEQLKTLQAEMEKAGADLARFCNYMQIDKLDALPAARYTEAMGMLAVKIKQDEQRKVDEAAAVKAEATKVVEAATAKVDARRDKESP